MLNHIGMLVSWALFWAGGYFAGLAVERRRHPPDTPPSELDELRRDLLFWRAQAVGQERNQYR